MNVFMEMGNRKMVILYLFQDPIDKTLAIYGNS